jgi:hypothetical protein
MNAYSQSQNGILYAGLGISEIIPTVSGFVRVFKRLDNETVNLFSVDANTQVRAELTARLSERVIIGASYDWTFAPLLDASGRVIDFAPQRRIEPRVNVNFKF